MHFPAEKLLDLWAFAVVLDGVAARSTSEYAALIVGVLLEPVVGRPPIPAGTEDH